MGNSASTDSDREDLDHQDVLDSQENANRTVWVPPVDHLKHKQRDPVADPDISIQNCSNLGINVGGEARPYNLCMCSIATHGEYEDIPLDNSDKQMFSVPENAMVFVFSAASPGAVSIGHIDSGPPEGSRMNDLFPNVYRPIDPNVQPITIEEACARILNADKDHIMNAKISAIRDSALNFTYMNEEEIKINLNRLSNALKREDYKTLYVPLLKESEEKKNTHGYVFTKDDNFSKDYLEQFFTSNSYSVKQYNPNDRMYIKKYTVSNKDRRATIDYSYDWNIFELFSGCNLTKFLSINSRRGHNFVTNKTIIEYCARTANSKRIRCVIILFDLSCSVFREKGYDIRDYATIEVLRKNVIGDNVIGDNVIGDDTEEMDAGGARNKRKHITHRKKNIKNRKRKQTKKRHQTKRKRRNNIK